MNIKPLVLTTVLTILTVNIATADDRLRDIDMDFMSLSKLCAPWVAPQTMAAIIETESQFRPWAIGVNGNIKLAHQPKNKGEAVITATALIANGYNIDLGLGQINSVNLEKTGLSVEDAFEPCKNLAASATILHSNYLAARLKVQGEQPTLYAALSAYNTGSFTKGLKNGYVQKVLNNAVVVPAITAIQLTETNAAKPAVKLKAQAKEEAVKFTVEGESEASQYANSNVYTNNTDKTDNVMVY